MSRLGFRRGSYNPCFYYHQVRRLRTFLHGDDFATVGSRAEIAWFRAALEKRFEIKTQLIGPGHSHPAGRPGAGQGLMFRRQ